MQNEDKKSLEQELKRLEEKMDAAVEKHRQIKQRLQELGDEESEESENLGFAEFNLFNYMDMLDEDIHELREKLAAL